MSNQNSSSPKPSNNRTKDLYREGKWPPEGHPWREVALLPEEETKTGFHSNLWTAISQGLRLMSQQAVSKMATATDLQTLGAAQGVYNIVEELLSLPDHIKGFHDKIRD